MWDWSDGRGWMGGRGGSEVIVEEGWERRDGRGGMGGRGGS